MAAGFVPGMYSHRHISLVIGMQPLASLVLVVSLSHSTKRSRYLSVGLDVVASHSFFVGSGGGSKIWVGLAMANVRTEGRPRSLASRAFWLLVAVNRPASQPAVDFCESVSLIQCLRLNACIRL